MNKIKLKYIFLIILLLLFVTIFFVFEKTSNVEFHSYNTNEIFNAESKELHSYIMNNHHSVFNDISKIYSFENEGTYKILDNKSDKTIVLINSNSPYKDVKYIKKNKDGIEIKIREKQFKNVFHRIKVYFSSAQVLPSSSVSVVYVEGEYKKIKITSNKKTTFKEIKILSD